MNQTQDVSRTRSALKDLSSIANIQSSTLTGTVDNNLENAKEDSISIMDNTHTNDEKQTNEGTGDVGTVKFESTESDARFQPKYTPVSCQDSSMDATGSEYESAHEGFDSSTILHLCDDLNNLILNKTEQENKLLVPSILNLHTDDLNESSNSKNISVVIDKQDKELLDPPNASYSAEDKHSGGQETNSSLLAKREELVDSLQNVFNAQENAYDFKTSDFFNLSKESELEKTLSEEQLISEISEEAPDFIIKNKVYDDNKSLSEDHLDDKICSEHYVNNNIGEQIITDILFEIIDSISNCQTGSLLQIEDFVIENNKSISKDGAQVTENILNEETSANAREKVESVSDDEFISGDAITDDFFAQQNCDLFKNPQDFEFLMKKGASKPSKNTHYTRASILANFDPFFVQCSPKKQTINISGSPVDLGNTVDKDFSSPSKHEVNESRKEGDTFSADILSTSDSNDAVIDQIVSILENLPNINVERAVDEVEKIKLFLVEKVKKDEFDTAQQDLQRHIASQEQEECRKEINSLQSQIQEHDCNIAKLTQVINEYDQIMDELVKDINSLRNECVETNLHLRSAEMALADVDLKFEKSSEIVWTMKSKQELALKAEVDTAKQFEEKETDYETLKTGTMQKLQSLNEEYINAINSHKKQVMVFDTMIKKSTVKNASLQRQLEQKISEQKELSEMCDNLVDSIQNHQLPP